MTKKPTKKVTVDLKNSIDKAFADKPTKSTATKGARLDTGQQQSVRKPKPTRGQPVDRKPTRRGVAS